MPPSTCQATAGGRFGATSPCTSCDGPTADAVSRGSNYATAAGFTDIDVLAIESGPFRFYRLTP
jgi:hypothetical protein